MLKFCRPGNFTYKQTAILFAKNSKSYKRKAEENLYRLKKHPKNTFHIIFFYIFAPSPLALERAAGDIYG